MRTDYLERDLLDVGFFDLGICLAVICFPK